MKQSKKLTRNQRKFLAKKKIDSTGYRLQEETNKYIKIIDENNNIIEIPK